MKEQVGFKSIKDSCEGRQRSRRRAGDEHSLPAFFCLSGRPWGLQRGRLKGGASWEMCSLSGQHAALASSSNWDFYRIKQQQPIFNPLAGTNCISLRWHMELASTPTPSNPSPPQPPSGTCSRFMSVTPSPSLSTATPPLIGMMATSPHWRWQPRFAAMGNASGVNLYISAS